MFCKRQYAKHSEQIETDGKHYSPTLPSRLEIRHEINTISAFTIKYCERDAQVVLIETSKLL
jgi:hypothetical protein